MNGRVLIACIGNIFLGDDGFGVEVARRLAERELPHGVCVSDFGIRGFDLAYALMDPWELVVLVDATQRGGSPGTLYVIEPEADSFASPSAVQPHGMDPMRAVELAKAMGGKPPRMIVMGCEPQQLGGDEGLFGLSDAVESAVEGAVEKVIAIAEEFLGAATAAEI